MDVVVAGSPPTTAPAAGNGPTAAAGAGTGVGRPYLACTNVGKVFGAFTALTDINLTIAEGELVSFLGPSGCGKTTLLRAIAGLDPPTTGTITQAGRDITGLPPSDRDFGIVFQSYALFPNLTVNANVGYGLRGPQWPRAKLEARVAELLSTVGLPEHALKYPAQLSGGQQQRVALARALANQPGLLLLDEPLSALDAIVRLHLRAEIRALQKRLGVTTILVTHDQEEALSISDRIVVMSQGRIEQVGTPEEIYRTPHSAFVANFVGRAGSFLAQVDTNGMLRAGSVALRAGAAERLAPGSSAHAFIRPEDVRLGDAARTDPAAFAATVTHVEFLGPFSRVSLDADGVRLDADIPQDELKRLNLGANPRQLVSISPDRVLAFTIARAHG
jgi:iron(III) transport system ATP-binding protein